MGIPTQPDQKSLIERPVSGSPANHLVIRSEDGGRVRDASARAKDGGPGDAAMLASGSSAADNSTARDTGRCEDQVDDNFASAEPEQRVHLEQQMQGVKNFAPQTSPVANFNATPLPLIAPSTPPSTTRHVPVLTPSGEVASNVVPLIIPQQGMPRRKAGRDRQRKVIPVGRHAGSMTAFGRQGHAANQAVSPKNWRDLSENEKFRASIEMCKATGGMAMTLNLSIGRAKSLLSEGNVTSPLRLFQNGLNRELKNAGLAGAPYSLKFEISPAGHLHLHGVLDHSGMDQDELRRFKDAFRNAAGLIKGRAGSSQLRLQQITHAAGWDRYISKAARRTSRHIGEQRLTLISQSMKRETRKFYEESHQNQ